MEEGVSLRLWKYDEDAILQEEQNERKKRFQKIGEDVFSFFQDKLLLLDLKIEKDNGKCPVKL